MYKLVIADDEEAILNGLSKFIDWNDLGFEVDKIFHDGCEVIEYLKVSKPDALLLDINMRTVSGLEVAKYNFQNKLNIKIVILSGYKEFDYAKQAIEYQVEHYLLKPTDMDELEKMFLEIRDKLDSEKSHMHLQRSLEARYSEAISIIFGQLVHQIGSGRIDDDPGIQKRLNQAGFAGSMAQYSCCMISLVINRDGSGLQNGIASKSSSDHELEEIFLKTDPSAVFSVLSRKNDEMILAGISKLPDVLLSEERIRQSIRQVNSTLYNFFKSTISMRRFEVLKSILDFKQAFGRFYSQSERDSSALVSPDIHMINRLFNDLQKPDAESAMIGARSYLKQIADCPVKLQVKLIHDVFANISFLFLYNGIDLSVISNGLFDYRQAGRLETMESLDKWVSKNIGLIANIVKYMDHNSSEVINKVMEYVKKNYADEITLETVSEYVYLNPSYLSRIFKQNTGENFSDYLAKVRIETAIRLLAENKLKIYEISERVGYKSSKYFIKLFRQFTGFTPKDYRVKIMEADREK